MNQPIPLEIWHEIFKYLSSNDLSSTTKVNTEWKKISSCLYLYRRLFEKEFLRSMILDSKHAPFISLMLENCQNENLICGVFQECFPVAEEFESVFQQEKNISTAQSFLQTLLSSSTKVLSILNNKSEIQEIPECACFGPAADMSLGLVSSLLELADIEFSMKIKTQRWKNNSKFRERWRNHGFEIKMPSQFGQTSQLTVHVLHARTREIREQLEFGGNRIVGSLIVENNYQDDLSSPKVSIEKGVTGLITKSNAIMYFLPNTRCFFKTEDPLREEFLIGFWKSIEEELRALFRLQLEAKSIAIVGISNRYNDLGSSDCYLTSIEIFNKLGRPEFLMNSKIPWRIYSLESEASNFKHFNEILQWISSSFSKT